MDTKTYHGGTLQELLQKYAEDRAVRDPEFKKESGDKNEVDVNKSPAD